MIIYNDEYDFGKEAVNDIDTWIQNHAPEIKDPTLEQRLGELFTKAQFESFLDKIDDDLGDYGPVKKRFVSLYADGTLAKLVEAWARYQESA